VNTKTVILGLILAKIGSFPSLFTVFSSVNSQNRELRGLPVFKRPSICTFKTRKTEKKDTHFSALISFAQFSLLLNGNSARKPRLEVDECLSVRSVERALC
jgi:hypothetical protein